MQANQLTNVISHGREVARRATKYLGELPLGLRLLSGLCLLAQHGPATPSLIREGSCQHQTSSRAHQLSGPGRVTDSSAQLEFPDIVDLTHSE